MTKEEIRKAARDYAFAKSNEKNTYFVGYKDIEKNFLNGLKKTLLFIKR